MFEKDEMSNVVGPELRFESVNSGTICRSHYARVPNWYIQDLGPVHVLRRSGPGTSK